ncbi:SDR family oxidoreductase [Rhodobacter sp. KR11]|jgi:ribitol 2-dehydrogenase|uniref:SDR family oxidoreductase n=1 Tax=Rhodobacter sp. KR11 TaxID=2974588 RepID=UPI002223C054|nr:SDR family oxidoreductase [Rhodobacter sp. KR11]MCW1919057.1 SDR family oxidoreductase [Rhodobacter sp. KR11]
MTLTAKNIAITGAASGIGLACVKAYLAEGATVVLIDRDEAALAQVCADLGPKALPLVADLLDPASIDQILPKILAQVPHLDVFHANAGAYIAGEVWTGDADAWDRMLYLNINAVFRCIHRILPHMIERGTGDILATSSVAGHTPVVWEPIYTASKHAVTAFVNAVRRQVLKHGIRVGELSPGPVETALLKDWLPERLAKAKADGALLGAEEIGAAAVFILSRPRTVTIRDIIILPAAFDI